MQYGFTLYTCHHGTFYKFEQSEQSGLKKNISVYCA